MKDTEREEANRASLEGQTALFLLEKCFPENNKPIEKENFWRKVERESMGMTAAQYRDYQPPERKCNCCGGNS